MTKVRKKPDILGRNVTFEAVIPTKRSFQRVSMSESDTPEGTDAPLEAPKQELILIAHAGVIVNDGRTDEAMLP